MQGHYRDRDKAQSLAEVIAPLAGQVGESQFGESGDTDTAVVENWREALRLCLAACNDDAVDSALLAILRPLPGETGTARARAVLAGLCLADEPNVSEGVANEVLRALAAEVHEEDGSSVVRSSLDAAAMELASSRWSETLVECLLDKYFEHEAPRRYEFGSVGSSVLGWRAPGKGTSRSAWHC